MAHADRPSMTFAQKARHELKEYAFLSAYLYVCFGAIVLYKMAILNGQDVEFLAFGIPAIKALILAKFILLAHVILVGERSSNARLVTVIAIKALLYLILLLFMSLIEECVVGLYHGRSLITVLTGMGRRLPEIMAMSAIMLLILIPYLASRELDVELGKGRLWSLLLEHRGARPLHTPDGPGA